MMKFKEYTGMTKRRSFFCNNCQVLFKSQVTSFGGNFVRINGDKEVTKCLMPGADFEHQILTGITTSEVNETYFSISTSLLNQKQDSVADLILQKKIPLSLINSNVYTSLREKDFER